MTSRRIRSSDSNSIWIKDEMERRLWLCDKWFAQSSLGTIEIRAALQAVLKSLDTFLDYREKYYNVNSKDDKIVIDDYMNQNDERSIRSKLAEYKSWWAANKTKSISVP